MKLTILLTLPILLILSVLYKLSALLTSPVLLKLLTLLTLPMLLKFSSLIQAFLQAILLMSIFEQRLSFECYKM